MGKPYMPLMMGDWIRGTRGMRADVKGVYIGLLIHQYDQGWLPADMETLALIEPQVGSVWVTLKDKFEEYEPGKLRNKKLEEVRDFWSKQAKNGSKGGRPKKNKPKRNPNNNPKANPNNNHHNDIDYDIDNTLNNKEQNKIIFPFDNPDFKILWGRWKQYRDEIKKPYRSVMSEQAALKMLSKYNCGTAMQMIEQSIANSWQGLFEIKQQNYGNGQNKLNANLSHINGLKQSREEAKARKAGLDNRSTGT